MLNMVSIFLLTLMSLNIFAYDYEKKVINNQIIHILRFEVNEYTGNLVKASNDIRRETVSSMAQKSHAAIAINGGFFEIGGQDDGKASGSLVIDGKVYNIKNHKQPLLIIKNGAIMIRQANPNNYKNKTISLVSGLPLLLNKGMIPNNLFNETGAFYTKPHARTAIGIDYNKKIIIVLIEHTYQKDIITAAISKINHKSNTTGLTIIELAKLMQNLKCKEAINLDGGGSSVLWINGHVVSNTIGDQDEAAGKIIERPVSDAIIFKKPKK